MATKEIYRIGIQVGVDGVEESKQKLSAMEKYTQQTEKRLKMLNKITASPTAKLKDQTSSAIDKINAKSKTLSRAAINPTARLNDQATSKLNRISTTIKKLENTNITANLRINDQASTYLSKVKAKSDRLKNTNINPTAKLTDQASDKIEKIKKNEDKLKDKKLKVQAKDEASGIFNKIESKINGWLKAGAKKVISLGVAGTVALGGVGLGTSVKTYSEYEKGLSNVKAVTNATDIQMKQLDTTAKTLGSTTAWSARHVTQAEELLGQAGFSVEETITALPGLLNLASAGDLDLAAATDIASGTLRAFNLNAEQSSHVADVLALSASATNSDVTDLGETMKYVAPVSQALGISLEDTAAASGLLSNANIKGSQAGTVLRQTMARLASPTSEAAKVMKKYGVNAFDAQGNMKPLSSVVDNLNSSLGKLTSQQRADVISTIFGTESMSGVLALMNQGGKSVSDLSKQLKDANGASQKMADTKLDNLNGQWIKLKAAVEHMQITLGERLAPYAKQFVTWLTGKMPAITDKIVEMVDYVSKHTDDIKTLATTVIGLGVAFTTLSAVGKLGNAFTGIKSFVSIFKGASMAAETAEIAGGLSNIGIIGKLLPAIFTPVGLAVAASVAVIGTAVVANNNLMKKSITTTTEELGPVEKIMNELNGHLNKSKKEMVSAGLIYDDFGEGVSNSFKKGAQDASKSLLKIEMDIKKLNRNGIADESGLNTLKNYVNDVAYESINAMKEQRSKIQSEFQKTFSLDGVTSDTEQKVLDSLGTFFEAGTNKQFEIRDEIYQFASDKIKEHGKLLDEDLKEIQDKIAKAKALELEYTKAQNAYDQAFSKSQFENDASKITGIDGASELLQERAKNHQSSLDKIENNYKGTLAYYNDLLSNNDLTSEERENFTKGRDSAETTRNQEVQQENEGYKSDKEVIYSHYEGARGMLNEKTGAKFSDEDIVAHKGTDYLKNHFDNVSQITQEGWYRIKNTSSNEMEDIYATIDKDTGEISGAWSKTANWSGGYTDEMKQKVKELGEAHETERIGIQNSLSALTGSTLDSNNQVISSTGSVIGQLQGVQGATDGAITGIININGTPMQITSNASGQITTMQEYKGSIDSIPPSADVHINSNANETTSEVSGLITKANEADGKTITITTIFKKITQWFDEKFDNAAKIINDHSTASNYKESSSDDNGGGYATGTESATRGWHDTAENGYEILIGRKKRWFNGCEKVLNHQQSKSFLENQQTNEPFKVNQGQYQLVQPQLQMAGSGGISVGDIQVSVNGNQDADEIVQEVVQVVGYKLKEALTNIKK